MSRKIPCRVAYIPFSYPDYPRDLVNRFIEKSEEMLRDLGLEVVKAEPVIELSDASRAISMIRGHDIDLIVANLVSWVEAPNVIAVLREFRDKPLILWSHTMFKEGEELLTLGPLPGAGVLRETLEEMGFRFWFIWGMPEEERVRSKISLYARVAHAAKRLSRSRIGLLGYASMGMYTGTFDHTTLRELIGPEVDQIDQYMIVYHFDRVSEDDVKKVIDELKKRAEIGEGVPEEYLMKTAKVYLALKKLVDERGWDALTVKCQYELSRYFKFAPCVPLSMLGDELPCSCEGDLPLIVTQLMMYYLTGSTTSYGDIHLITDKYLLIGACGFAPFSLADGRPKIGRHTALYEGLLNMSNYRSGKVTLARLAYLRDRGYKMHIAVGEAMPPEPFHEVGCPPYPSMKVVLEGDTEHFGQNMCSQHYAIVYGDISNELIELCKLLGIRAIKS